VASIFGSSSHLINGPTSAISLLVFSALAFLDPENRFDVFQALFLLGVMAGTIQITIAVFKLGDLTRYISESVILGFMTGASFLLAVGQIGNALGVRDKGNGRMHVLRRLWLTLTQGDPINLKALFISAATVVSVRTLRTRSTTLASTPGFPPIGSSPKRTTSIQRHQRPCAMPMSCWVRTIRARIARKPNAPRA
jgi:sulfate permease, SulP family